jgi:dTDP-glucose 4,6-dehydratase
VEGDGTPIRSYLYASELVIWLLTILARGKSGDPYNVGSEAEMNVRTLAAAVAESFDPPREVRVAIPAAPGRPAERYVPCTAKSRTELGLRQTVDAPEAIQKTVRWCMGREEQGIGNRFRGRDS